MSESEELTKNAGPWLAGQIADILVEMSVVMEGATTFHDYQGDLADLYTRMRDMLRSVGLPINGITDLYRTIEETPTRPPGQASLNDYE
tara:strand:+ start:1996 stop:2262 length:267 start_codon:yes stop_codon:yes gene_type:complete